jgi:hypothetical protein
MSEQPPQDPGQPEPGWYPGPDGQQVLRWWDGAGWAAQTQPMPGPAPRLQPPYPGPQPYPLVQVTQQAVFPGRAVTRRPLGVMETCFHLGMTVMTCGMWGVVWWSRVRMRRSYTTFR